LIGNRRHGDRVQIDGHAARAADVGSHGSVRAVAELRACCTPHEDQLTCRGSLLAEPRDRASDAVARFNLT
jgi:hypothetical protein